MKMRMWCRVIPAMVIAACYMFIALLIASSIALFFVRCQMSDYRSAEASTLMLMSLRKDFMPHGLFLVRTRRPP